MGDRAEKSSRLADVFRPLARQHTQEGVVRQVRRIKRVADLPAQPTLQLALMAAVERFDGRGRRAIGHGSDSDGALKKTTIK